MAYVIVDTCTKDEHCIEACPVNCIHPSKDDADFETVAQSAISEHPFRANRRAMPPFAPCEIGALNQLATSLHRLRGQ